MIKIRIRNDTAELARLDSALHSLAQQDRLTNHDKSNP